MLAEKILIDAGRSSHQLGGHPRPAGPAASARHLNQSFTPIERSGVTERVVQRIKDMLARGELKPGNRLPPERELAVLLNISRPTLRTALKALSVMGLIEAKPGAGTYLVETPVEIFNESVHFTMLFHQTGLAKLLEVRRLIEPGLAELAAGRASVEAMQVMAQELEAMRDSVNEPEKFLSHDLSFHQALARAADNQVLSGIINAVAQMLFPIRRQMMERATASEVTETIDDHERLYQAVRGRNPRWAKALMASHLRTAEQVWLREESAEPDRA